jgi:hypothetical protein
MKVGYQAVAAVAFPRYSEIRQGRQPALDALPTVIFLVEEFIRRFSLTVLNRGRYFSLASGTVCRLL